MAPAGCGASGPDERLWPVVATAVSIGTCTRDGGGECRHPLKSEKAGIRRQHRVSDSFRSMVI